MFYLRDAEDDLEKVPGGTEEKSEEFYLLLYFIPGVLTELCEV